jgi:ABC-type transport system involved in cytochrome bd biosynthesis fused ATPase/permease subunit
MSTLDWVRWQFAIITLFHFIFVRELDEWTRALPRGLDTVVGQFGERVSGGERQRLALARAALTRARFVIFDEPTAHLDGQLATRVLDALLERCAGRGVLVITHDDRRLAGFDRILRLAGGRLLTAFNTHPIDQGA